MFKVFKYIIFLIFLNLFPFVSQAIAATAGEYLTAGNQLYATKSYAQASIYYQAAINLDPNNAAAYQGLGSCQYFQGRQADALVAFRKAYALNPNNPQLLVFIRSLEGAQTSLALPATQLAPKLRLKDQFVLNGDFPANGQGPALGLGMRFYFRLNDQLQIGLGTNYSFFLSWEELENTPTYRSGIDLLAENFALLRYRFPVDGFTPYLLAGGGFGLKDITISSNLVVYSNGYPIPNAPPHGSPQFGPLVTGGLGFETPLSDTTQLFLEARVSVIFCSGVVYNNDNVVTETIEAGPYLFFPLNAGMNFNL